MITSSVHATIESVIKRQLHGHSITRIDAASGKDFDGDEVLTITIVIDDDITKYDPKSLSGLVRHLRSSLYELDVDAFPLIGFMTTAEAREEAA